MTWDFVITFMSDWIKDTANFSFWLVNGDLLGTRPIYLLSFTGILLILGFRVLRLTLG